MERKTYSPLQVFISYAHRDEEFRKELEIHLSLLKRSGLISAWSDRVIQPGKSWEKDIDQNIEKADIVLCLISPDFLASEYCYEVEMRRALELHDEEKLIILPIVLRHSSWHMSPLAEFQALPTNGEPITSWQDRDKAWLSISNAIEAICNQTHKLIPPREVSHQVNQQAFSVAVFGMTGAGKSSIINALAGQEVVRVSDVIAITKSVQEWTWEIHDKNAKIQLFDCPGLGEDYTADEEYRKIYNELLENIDLAIWVQHCSSRIIAEGKRYIQSPALRPFVFGPKIFLLVINQVDSAPPTSNWNDTLNRPGKSQQVYIERRMTHLAGAFGLPTSSMVTVSALKEFNVNTLKQRVLQLLSK